MSSDATGYETIWVVLFGVDERKSYREDRSLPSMVVADNGHLCQSIVLMWYCAAVRRNIIVILLIFSSV